MTADPRRAAYTAGLRQLADILDASPEVPVPSSCGYDSPAIIYFGGDTAREDMAAARKAIGGQWAKTVTGNWAELTTSLAGFSLMLYAQRDAVCTRRVVGTEQREVEEEIRPAETRKVVKTVEVVEWICEPILSDRMEGSR